MKSKFKISVLIIGVMVAAYCLFTTIINQPMLEKGNVLSQLDTPDSIISVDLINQDN